MNDPVVEVPAMIRPSRGSILGTLRWLANADSPIAAVLQNVLTQLALIVVSFGTGIIIARNLGAAGRGGVAALTLWPMIFSGLFAFGIPAALVHYSRRFPLEQASLFSAALAISGTVCTLMIGAGFLIIPRSLHQYDARTIHWALGLMFVAPQILIGYSVTSFFQIRGKFAFFNQTRYVPAVATLLSLLALLYFRRLTPENAALCYLLPPLPMFALALYRVSRMISFQVRGLRESVYRLLNYGSRAAGIDLLGTLSAQVDQFLIVGFLSPATMGTYVVALSVSRVLNIIFVAVNMVLSPELVGRTPHDMTEYLGRSIRITIFFGAIGALLIAAVVPILLPRLYGGDFGASVPVVFVLLGDILLSGPTSTIAEAFKASGRPGLVTMIEAATLASSVVLMITIIPRLGVIGAAIALLLASLLRLLAIVSFYPRVVGTRFPRFILERTDIEYAVGRLKLQLGRTS
ncbi:MAG: hypothetical protein NVS2B3_01530 [Vulcanimicrobiaceae bacterium]